MQIPQFVKEVIWCFYPPRYKQLSEKKFSSSLWFMTRMLFIAFIVSSLFFLPKLISMKGEIEDGLSQFSALSVQPALAQSSPFSFPESNPWVVVDLNSNLSLSKELVVIDQTAVHYRFFNIANVSQETLFSPIEHKATVAGFLTKLFVLFLPGVALFLFVRFWFKYFLMTLIMGTLFFIIMELSQYRLRYKQMLSIAAHAVAPIMILEVVSAAIYSSYLLPLPTIKFAGLYIYAVSFIIMSIIMAAGIVGCKVKEYSEKKKK